MAGGRPRGETNGRENTLFILSGEYGSIWTLREIPFPGQATLVEIVRTDTSSRQKRPCGVCSMPRPLGRAENLVTVNAAPNATRKLTSKSPPLTSLWKRRGSPQDVKHAHAPAAHFLCPPIPNRRPCPSTATAASSKRRVISSVTLRTNSPANSAASCLSFSRDGGGRNRRCFRPTVTTNLCLTRAPELRLPADPQR